MSRRTRPTTKTRAAERREAKAPPRADRTPSSEEERLAELHHVDAAVAEHVEEMLERGANQAGEGRVP